MVSEFHGAPIAGSTLRSDRHDLHDILLLDSIFGRLRSRKDILCLWSAIEDEVKGGEVWDKIPPELRIDNGWGAKEF